MKTKSINKKEKKRSFSESSFFTESEQKPQNLTEPKKGSKKIKTDNAQNGSFMVENKVLTTKRTDKQKKEDKIVKYESKESIEKSLINAAKMVAVETKEGTLSKTKQKKLVLLKKRQEQRDFRKATRKERGTYNVASIKLSVEQIKNKVAEIKSRKELSKTAKRKLGVLQRKLRIEEELSKLKESDTTEEKDNEKDNDQVGALIKNKQKADNKTEMKIKKEPVVKLEVDSEEDNSDSMEDHDEDDSEDRMDIGDVGEIAKDQSDDENDEDEEDEENEEDEEDEESSDEEETIVEVKKEKKKQAAFADKLSDDQKKKEDKEKQYVLYAGNLPYELTEDELKQHFLTKVDKVVSVKIPKLAGTTTPRGFAFIEVSNKVNQEKALSLDQTVLKKRKINVQYTSGSKGGNKGGKPDVFAKNKKQAPFHKAGKLAGSHEMKKLQKKAK